LKLISIFNIVSFWHCNENREDWLNIDTIRILYKIIYLLNSIYYKNPTEFFSNRDVACFLRLEGYLMKREKTFLPRLTLSVSLMLPLILKYGLPGISSRKSSGSYVSAFMEEL